MKNKIDFSMPNFSTQLYKFDEMLRFNLGSYIELEARDTAPVDTGVYRNNINYDGKYTITANANYSAAIEYGIAANENKVFPKAAKTLHFKVNGEDVFVKWSRPFKKGRRPNPVMRNAARTVMKRDFNRIYDDLFKKYF